MKRGPKPRTPEQIPNCVALGCDRKATHGGLCDSHYRRVLAGKPLGGPIRPPQPPVCTIEGCARAPRAKGQCAAHYQQSTEGRSGTLREVGIPNRVEIAGAEAWIILTGAQGIEVARTVVDSNDLGELLAHRWRAARSSKAGAKTYVKAHGIGGLHAFLLQPPPGFEVDHINRDPLDNRRANLRIVTHRQNAENKGDAGRANRLEKLPRNVYRNGRGYKVTVTANGRQHYRGGFASIEEADAAAKSLRLELLG